MWFSVAKNVNIRLQMVKSVSHKLFQLKYYHHGAKNLTIKEFAMHLLEIYMFSGLVGGPVLSSCSCLESRNVRIY